MSQKVHYAGRLSIWRSSLCWKEWRKSLILWVGFWVCVKQEASTSCSAWRVRVYSRMGWCPWQEMHCHSSQTTGQNRSGSRNQDKFTVVRQVWGQAGMSSWRMRIFIRATLKITQLQQLRRGQRRSARALKSSKRRWGCHNKVSYSFLTKISSQQPDPMPHGCTTFQLPQAKAAKPTGESRRWPWHSYWTKSAPYALSSPISAQDDSDTSGLNTVIKLNQLSWDTAVWLKYEGGPSRSQSWWAHSKFKWKIQYIYNQIPCFQTSSGWWACEILSHTT